LFAQTWRGAGPGRGPPPHNPGVERNFYRFLLYTNATKILLFLL
jgi:hypothetical protein